ncbi:hypothetical protein [Shewanella gaetbuli]|uniref:Uncharacterized protein n=1 Tax=Shewanella gaetbuli TaxID=220752 RepID=A0A9X1ZIH7_9GAMM|nr:hypothetical protein [Shewanella gaetbuli]MCL1142959.1 hypothetical protein [Shewanella gaetbuli]
MHTKLIVNVGMPVKVLKKAHTLGSQTQVLVGTVVAVTPFDSQEVYTLSLMNPNDLYNPIIRLDITDANRGDYEISITTKAEVYTVQQLILNELNAQKDAAQDALNNITNRLKLMETDSTALLDRMVSAPAPAPLASPAPAPQFSAA